MPDTILFPHFTLYDYGRRCLAIPRVRSRKQIIYMTPIESPIDWSEISIMSILVAFSMLSVMAFSIAIQNNGLETQQRKEG
jgi:hypothetical protein